VTPNHCIGVVNGCSFTFVSANHLLLPYERSLLYNIYMLGMELYIRWLSIRGRERVKGRPFFICILYFIFYIFYIIYSAFYILHSTFYLRIMWLCKYLLFSVVLFRASCARAQLTNDTDLTTLLSQSPGCIVSSPISRERWQ
jgi:hypothetical protein